MITRPRRPPYERRPLTDQQIFRASTLWDEEGKSLGEIAEEVGCSVYQLGFLYRELLPHMRRVDITPIVEGQLPEQVRYPITLPRGDGLYAVGFRDLIGLLPGYEAGPSSLREMKAYTPGHAPPDTTPVIVHLTRPLKVVAEWNAKFDCWISVVDKKRGSK